MSETENRTMDPLVKNSDSNPAGGLVFLYSSGTLVSSAAAMEDVALEAGGNDLLQVSSGGNATEITILEGGSMTVAARGNIAGINLESGGIYSGGGNCSGNSKWYGPGICNTGGTLHLSGGTFTDNVACKLNGYAGQGGAVENFQGTMNVSRCVFSGNTADGGGGGAVLAISAVTSDTFIRDTFEGNRAKYGGGMEISAESAVVSSCTFLQNSADDGGGLELHSGASVTVRDTVFEANSAIRGGAVEVDVYGGAKSFLRMSGGTFTGNTATAGGAIYNIAETVVSGGVFESNSADSGGAIHTSDGKLTISSVVFSGNTARHDPDSWTDGFGGAVDGFGATSMTFQGGTFESNQAEYGGAAAAHIEYMSPDHVSLQTGSGVYLNNTANYGGALYFQANDGDVMTVTDGVFQGNSASYGGGAICNCYGTLTISGGTFGANSAGNDGGAAANWNYGQVSNAVFTGNSAAYGGALSNSYGVTLSVSGCEFVKNVSTAEGGAIWQNEFSVSTDIGDSTFEGNVSVAGGAVSNGSVITVTDCSFTANDATTGGAFFNTGSATITGGTFEGNTADLGGAVYTSNGSLELTSVVFSGNTARHDPDSWTDGFGGAVDGFGTTVMTFQGGTFESNQAEYGGAAAAHVTYMSSDHVSLQTGSGTYLNNTANYGGALYFQANDGDVMTVTDGVFQGNSASWGGGAVCNCYGSMTITGGTFTGNTAGNDGGAAANWNYGQVSNAVFTGNTAAYGGALSNSYGMTLSVSGCTFTENTGTAEGGAIWQDEYSASVTVENSVFSGNSSPKGGAIGNAGTMTVSGCSFLTATDTIDNSGTLTFTGSNTLEAAVANSGEVILTLSGEPVLSRWLVENTGTLSLSAAAAEGTWQIAGDAASFDDVFSLRLEGEEKLSNVLSLSKRHIHEGLLYELSLTEGTLALTVSGYEAALSDDILGTGCSQILAWDAEHGKTGCAVTAAAGPTEWRGIWEWSGEDIERWSVAGTGLFEGGRTDRAGVLLYNRDNSTFAAWTDLDDASYGYVSLLYVGNDFGTEAVRDLDGDGYDDILIRNEAGSVGIVSGGTSYHDVWHVEDSADPVWTLQGAGNFTGSDQASLLFLRNEDGHLYRWDNQDVSYSSWNWTQTDLGELDEGWSVAAIADFQGDGKDDIILLQDETGYVFACEDGDLANRRWVGALDLENDFRIECAGDYDGDGKADLLLREYKSGWGGVGCWAGADANQWKDLNVNIETSTDSSFQIVG